MTDRSATRPSALILWLAGVLAIMSLCAVVVVHMASRATASQSINISVPVGTQAQMDAAAAINKQVFGKMIEAGVVNGDGIGMQSGEVIFSF